MAKFIKRDREGRCNLCGRLSEERVGILYSHNPTAARPRVHERLDICGRCGEIIYKIATKGEPDIDRTRTHERHLPPRHKPKDRSKA